MITITREKKFKRQGWDWIYSLVGPDGYRSSNKSADLLRQVAEKRYPGVEITEEWNQEDETPDTVPPWAALKIVLAAADCFADEEFTDDSEEEIRLEIRGAVAVLESHFAKELEGETT